MKPGRGVLRILTRRNLPGVTAVLPTAVTWGTTTATAHWSALLARNSVHNPSPTRPDQATGGRAFGMDCDCSCTRPSLAHGRQPAWVGSFLLPCPWYET